ncbi:MAG: leucine-rich repeat protein [Acutalibacteraceae bacterium]
MKTETSFLGKLFKKVLSTALSVLLVFGTFGSTVAFAIDGGNISAPTVTIEADGNIDTPVNLESDGTVTCGIWYTAEPDTSFKILSAGEGYYVVESYNCGDPKIAFGDFTSDDCGGVTYHDSLDFFAYMYLTEYDLEYETGTVLSYSGDNIVFRVMYMADVCPQNTNVSDGNEYDVSKIQNIELSVVRDIYANFEGVSNAFQALITFENGTEFVYDMCYSYDYDISYEKANIYNGLCDWFINDWSFECADSTAAPGTVSVNVTCTNGFEYSGTFDVTVVETPVDRIEVKNNLTHYDYETTEIWALDKDGYSIDNLDLVIHYKDGTQIDVKEWFQNNDYSYSSYDGRSMVYTFGEAPEYGYETYLNHRHSICYSADQVDTDWTVGNSYPVTVEYLGVSAEYYVEIVENPVESIEFIPAKPIELVYEVDGYNEYVYNYETGEESQFFYYDYSIERNGNVLRVNYTDGSSKDYTFSTDNWGFRDENGNRLESYSLRDTQYSNHWSSLGEYSAEFSCMGRTCNVPVFVIENPVESIEFIPAKPIELICGVDGYVSERYDEQSDSWVEFFRYSYSIRQEGNIFRVNYSDGRTVDYTYYEDCWDFCDKDGNILEGFSVDDSQYNDPWDSLGQYNIEIGYISRTCNVTVSIIENPVESIEFVLLNPIEVMYETNGYWNTKYDYETHADEYYFRYSYSYRIDEVGNILRVNYTDGSTVDYVFDENERGFCDSNGNEIRGYSIDDTQYENHWTNVGTYYATVSYMSRECQVPVTVTESPVASINYIPAEPFRVVYEYDGYIDYIYNHETDEYEEIFKYSYFNQSSGSVLEVTYKDGSVDRFVSEYGYFDFDYENANIFNFDTQETSPWTEVGTYYATVKFMGASCQVPVVVYDSAYPHLRYSIVDGKAYITGVKGSFEGETLEIPDELEGYTVVGLSDNVIPWFIKTVNLPASLVSISSEAFSNCEELETITVEEGNTAYESYNGVLYTKDRTEIVKIPNKFSGELYIPATFKEQDFEDADLSQATSIVVDSNNPYIVYENGVFYSIDKTRVIKATLEVSANYTMPATVNEIHSSAFFNNSVLESVNISSSVVSISYATFAGCSALKSVTLPSKLESIEHEAFAGCTSLVSISMPASLRSIGYRAFGDTTSLKTVSLNNGLQTIETDVFAYSGLESVVIPGSVETICYNVFRGCGKLTSATISNGVKTIDYAAFKDCTKLSSISIADSVTSVAICAFENTAYYNAESNWVNGVLYIDNILIEADENISGSYSIKQGAVTVADDAFCNCGKITAVTIPESVATIGNSAFCGCSNLQSVEIESPDVVLGSGAFYDCESLNTINFADGLKEVPYECFAYSAITSLKLPDTVTDIGYRAFAGSESLAEVDLPANLQHLGGHSFSGTKWYADQPNGVIYLDNFLYGYKANCPDKLEIKANTRGIAAYALQNSQLSEVTIPESVEYINEYAFYTCTNLKSVTIPANVKEIGEYAFGYYEKNYSNPLKVTDFVIKGYVGSVAEQYAKDNGFEFVPLECNHINTAVINAKKATCTEAGYTGDTVCTDCGTVVKAGSKINAMGHKSSDWIIDKNATVNAAGSKHKECTVCGQVLETEIIPQLKCAAPKLTKVESTGSGVKVTWGKTSGADSYIVYRKSYSDGKWSGWNAIKPDVSGSATSYTDTTAKSGVYYIYTVRGVNEAGKGSYDSSGLKIKFLSTPKLSSVANGSGKVTVKWSKVTGASSYTVYRKTYSNGKWSGWSKIGTTKNTYYNDTKVSSGKYYKYTVRATSGDYIGYYNTSGLQIKYLAVASIKSAVSQKDGIKVIWGKVTGAKGYEVYRKTYSNGKWSGWTKIKTVSSGSTVSYTDKSAKKGVTYKYTVRAISDSNKGYYNTNGLQVKDKY